MIVAAISLWLASVAASDPAEWKPSHAPTDEDRRLAAIAADAAAHSASVTRWDDLPQGLRDAFLEHRGIKGMADAGGRFNPSDSGYSTSPRIRLRYAISAQNHWFVCYETGGMAHLYHVAIWSPDPPTWLLAEMYRSGPLPQQIGPDLAQHFYFDEAQPAR